MKLEKKRKSMVSTSCCKIMDYHLNFKCDKHKDPWECPDIVLIKTRTAYLIPIRDGGRSGISIEFCPWCGSRIKENQSKKRSGLPDWVTRGKPIRQLIKELRSFKNQNLEVRLTFDDGETHFPISILTRQRKGSKYYCMLENSEQSFAKAANEAKVKTKRKRP
jgi:hypothetical protein